MPFTLSHPAAAVPLAKCGLPLSAVVIGSIVPDLPYFLRMSTGKLIGHSFVGIFIFCVPVGMLMLWVFHVVLKQPLLSLLPVKQQERLAPVGAKFRFGPSRQFFLIILALGIGALTHVIWDSFTHAHDWPVQQFSIFRLPVLQSSLGTILVFNLLQRGSTLVGAALLIYWYIKWLKRAPAQPVQLPVNMPANLKLYLVSFMAVAALLVASVYSYWRLPEFSGLGWLRPFARRLANGGISVGIVELLIFSFAWHLRASRSRPSEIMSHQRTAQQGATPRSPADTYVAASGRRSN